jgi:hypothetical protein
MSPLLLQEDSVMANEASPQKPNKATTLLHGWQTLAHKYQADLEKQTTARAEPHAKELQPLQKDVQKLDKEISDLKKKKDDAAKKLFKEKEKEHAALLKQIEQQTAKFDAEEKQTAMPIGKDQKLAKTCNRTLRHVQRTALLAARKPDDPAAVHDFTAAKQAALGQLLLYTKYRVKTQPMYEHNKLLPPGRAAWYVTQLKLAILRLRRLDVKGLEEADTADQTDETPFGAAAAADLSAIDKDLAAISDADLARAEEAPDEAEGSEAEEQDVLVSPGAASAAGPAGSAAPPRTDPLAAQWKERWDKVTVVLKAALQANVANAVTLEKLAKGALELAHPGGYAQALEVLTRLEALLRPAASDGRQPINAAGLGSWQAARDKALTELRHLAEEIAASKDEDAREALILVNSIIKHLPANPTDLQHVADLERYLVEDDAVADACLALDLRDPLLVALNRLKS